MYLWISIGVFLYRLKELWIRREYAMKNFSSSPQAISLSKRNSLSFRFRRAVTNGWQLYLLLALPLLYIFIFNYGPMVGLQIAFKEYSSSNRIFASPWVGLRYFSRFVNDPQFVTILINTLRISLYSLVITFPFPVILALCVNLINNQRYKKSVQLIMYAPHFISLVVLIGMLNQIIDPNIGLLHNLGETLFGIKIPNLNANPDAFAHLYVWSEVWQNMGYNSIIYLAALSAVSTDLHEAAQIDGASRLKRVYYIDFPCLIPTMVILLIMNSGRIMSVGFEKINLMQNELNRSQSEVISTYVYRKSFVDSNGFEDKFSYSTAIGLFNSVVNLILITAVNKIANRYGDTSLW